MEPFQKVAVHAYIKRGSNFLVTLRSNMNDYKPGEWDFPGGTVEFSEEPIDALEREILEETQLEVDIFKPIYICSQTQDKRHQFWIIYECEYKKGNIQLNPEEHSKYVWVDKNDAKKLKKIFFLDNFYNNYLSK